MSTEWMKRRLYRAERVLARSSLVLRAAIKLRNQTNILIGLHHADGTGIADSGEELMADHLAPRCFSFVDVGANVGDWTAMFASRMTAGRGICIEPGSHVLPRLRECISRIAPVQVTLLNCAVGDASEALTFWEHQATDLSGFFPAEAYGTSTGRPLLTRRLDEILREAGWESVDFLKIDTEGFDCKVMQGAGSFLDDARIKVVQFEYGGNWRLAGATLSGAVRYLRARGYTTFLLRKDGLRAFDADFIGEYFMFSNFVAVRTSDVSELASLLIPDRRRS